MTNVNLIINIPLQQTVRIIPIFIRMLPDTNN